MDRCILLSAALLVSAAGCNIPSLEVYAGSATESVAGKLRADSSGGATGDTLDLEGDLGATDKSSPLDMRLVFAKGGGMLDLSYSERSISSTGTLTGTPEFTGVSLNNGAVSTDLSVLEYRACVGRRKRSKGKRFIASARAGVMGVDWSATLSDSLPQTVTAQELTVFPVVGAGLEAKMGPLASFFVEAEGMDMNLSDTRAQLLGWGAGLKISFVQAKLMLGYRSRSLDIEKEGQRLSLDTDGGTIAFQLQLSLGM